MRFFYFFLDDVFPRFKSVFCPLLIFKLLSDIIQTSFPFLTKMMKTFVINSFLDSDSDSQLTESIHLLLSSEIHGFFYWWSSSCRSRVSMYIHQDGFDGGGVKHWVVQFTTNDQIKFGFFCSAMHADIFTVKYTQCCSSL